MTFIINHVEGKRPCGYLPFRLYNEGRQAMAVYNIHKTEHDRVIYGIQVKNVNKASSPHKKIDMGSLLANGRLIRLN